MLAKKANVVTGTDAPIDHVATSTHMNLRAMTRFGISPRDALVTATSATGEFFRQPIGRIAPGMLADLIVVDGDPLTRIDDVAKVTETIVGGIVHTPEELIEPYAKADAATAKRLGAGVPSPGPGRTSVRPTPNRVTAPVPTHPSTREFWWNDPAVLEAARTSCCEHP